MIQICLSINGTAIYPRNKPNMIVDISECSLMNSKIKFNILSPFKDNIA